MVIAGFWFTVGAAINAGARDLAMLYIGRVLLGFGVGFANQAVSCFLLQQTAFALVCNSHAVLCKSAICCCIAAIQHAAASLLTLLHCLSSTMVAAALLCCFHIYLSTIPS